MTLSTMIIDPDTPDRERLRSYLDTEPAVRVVGTCSTGTEAIGRIRSLRPDLLFLDLELPESDGFRLLEDLQAPRSPGVIVTTKTTRNAHRAFEFSAVDYLIKPIEKSRLGQALQRASQRLADPPGGAKGSGYAERLAIRSPGSVRFLRVDEIEWIEADGNYVQLHADNDVYRMRQTLTAVEGYLDPERFVRIHRSALVNSQRIEALKILAQGEHALTLTSGQELQTSRGCRGRLMEILRAYG